MPDYLRFLSIWGAIILVASLWAWLVLGHRSQAAPGVVIGGAIVVVCEWLRWRSRASR
jgi:hypothetical protein